MSIADPHTVGITLNGTQTPQISLANKRLAVLERSGGGGTIVGGGGGSTPDADAVTKGKVKLAGHLAGTADAPLLSTTATPQTLRFGLGVASQPAHALTVGSGSAFGNTIGGFYHTDYPDYTAYGTAYHAQRYVGTTATTVRIPHYQSLVNARGGGQLNGSGWVGYAAAMIDQAGVKLFTITSISAAGLVTISGAGPHGYQAGERVLIYGTTLAGHNDDWIVAASPAPTNTTFTLTSAPASSSTGGKVTNSPFMVGFTSTVIPQLDRSIAGPTIGGALDADDVNAYVGYNAGPGRATDGNYLTSNAAAFSGRSAWITGFTVDTNCDFPFKVGAYLIGASNSLGAYPGNEYGACFDCSTATLAPGAHAMRIMNDGAIVWRNDANSAYVHGISVAATTDQLHFVNGGQSVSVWGAGASPTPTNVGGRVFQLAGTPVAIPELKIYAAGPSSKTQINMIATDASSAQRVFHINNDATVPWTILGTQTAQPLALQANNAEIMRLTTAGNVELASAAKIGFPIGAADVTLARSSANTLTLTGNLVVTGTFSGGSGGGMTPTYTMPEQASTPAAVADSAILFARDNGANKTQICCVMPSGTVLVLGTDI